MRKVLSLLLVVILLIPCGAHAEATKTHTFVEFLELYAKRITELQSMTGVDLGVELGSSTIDPFLSHGDLVFSSAAGLVTVNMDDYTINHIIMDFYYPAKEDNTSNIMNCLVAISALEYDYVGESILSLSNTTPLEEVMQTMVASNYFEAISNAMNSKDKVQLFSGNYDYSLAYSKNEKYEVVYLIAEERK